MLPATASLPTVQRQAWGRLPGMVVDAQVPWSLQDVAFAPTGMLLPYGRGRSYGDSCLAAGGLGLGTERLDRLLAFDRSEGVLACESGTSLADILDVITPAGWTLPVMPGTQYVSVGGAIANDVHGKNHERRGTFGRHVLEFELLRSDGSRTRCAPDANPEMFAATIGGLGLTGLVTHATLALAPLPSTQLVTEAVPFASVDAFVELSEQAQATQEFTVAWFDAYSYRRGTLRGVFQRARYADDAQPMQPRDAASAARAHASGGGNMPRGTPIAYARKQRRLPLGLASHALHPWAMRRFNALYYRVQRRPGLRSVNFRQYLFPLDAIAGWNRLYGAQGFYQLQCVFPVAAMRGVDALLALIAQAREGSFLAVLKRFGSLPSPGPMSFPMAGITLALDFRNNGASTQRLLANAAALVTDHGGRIYPAKDATMSAKVFQAGYPAFAALDAARDPRFLSRFWQRVTA